MKFLCPSCKAKYQIADEKIAGRSVRMKCRKCGFIIPISDVPPAPETMAPSDGDLLSRSMVPRAPTAPSLDSSPPWAPEGAKPTPPPSRPGAPKPAPPKPPPRASSPVGAPRPAPAGASRVPPRAATPAAKPAVPEARPAVPTASAPGPVASPLASAMSAVAVSYDTDEDEATRVATAAMGGLDTGFKAIVNKEPPPESVGMPADEWFVGVNGSPIGPIRLSDLRAKAASGAVTLESLVWRDGYEEWRPLKTFPELVAVVEESLSSVRASMTPFVPSRPSAPSPSTSIAPKPAPIEAKPVSSSSDVTAPITATAPAPAPAPSPAPASTAVTGSALVTDEIAVPRQRMPFAAMAAIAVALALGLTLGFVIFSGQSEPVVQYVQVPASSAPAALTPALENAAPAPPPVATTEEGKKPGGTTGTPKTGAGSTVATKGSAPTEPEKTGSGLSGLKGLSGLGASGPSGPSGGTTTPSSGSSQLDGAQVQSTVSRYTGSVKRSCWQPALDSRDPNAPTSARVVVTITVAGSGSVQNVTTSGDPRGYPGLANCIAGRVRGWQFPPSSGTTTVNVPFVFAAQ